MKFVSVFVVTLCFAAAFASFKGVNFADNVGKYGGAFNKFGKQAYGLGVGLNDAAKAAQAASAFKAGGGQFADRVTDFGKAAGQGFAKKGASQQAFGANKAAFGADAAGKNTAAAASGHNSGYAGNFAAKAAANKGGYGNQFGKKAGFNKGGVLGNNVNYAFDKKFNNNAAETGGFVLEESSNKHALDDYRDRQTRFGLGQDAFGAKKGSAYGAQNAAAAQGANGSGKKGYNAGNFGKGAFNQHDNSGRLHSAGNNLLSKAGANNFYSDARDAALHKANNYAAKDSLFGRNAGEAGLGYGNKAFGNGAGKFLAGKGFVPYNGFGGYGLGGYGGDGGYGGRGGYGGDGKHPYGYGGYGYGAAPYGKGYGGYGGYAGLGLGKGAGIGLQQGGFAGNGFGQKASLFDKGANRLAAANGAFGSVLGARSLNKGQGGFLNAKGAYGNDNGFFKAGNNKAGAAGYGANALGASAYGGFNKGAKAAQAGFGNAAAAGHKGHLNKLDASNLKRVQSDRNSNRRVLKNFFTKKNSGGDNFERLNYNNKNYNQAFGNQAAAGANAGNQFGAANFLAKQNAAAANNFGKKAANNFDGYNQHAAKAAAGGFGSNANAAYGQNQGYGKGYGRDAAQNAYNNQKAGFDNAQNAARLYNKNNYGQGAGGFGNQGYGAQAAAAASRGGALGYGGLGYGAGLGYGGGAGYGKGIGSAGVNPGYGYAGYGKGLGGYGGYGKGLGGYGGYGYGKGLGGYGGYAGGLGDGGYGYGKPYYYG